VKDALTAGFVGFVDESTSLRAVPIFAPSKKMSLELAVFTAR
jgi:hypothetical protein